MFKEFIEFIRPNLCLSGMLLIASGYFIQNNIDLNYLSSNGFDLQLIYLLFVAFLLTAFTYAYNTITDVKEDLLNKGKINYFADKTSGKIIVAVLGGFGLFFAFLSNVIQLSVIFVIAGIVYSRFRIKKLFLIKNVYTAFFLSFIFFMGMQITSETALSYTFMIGFITFIGSIIADIRDIEGDLKTGINTLAAHLGPFKTKTVVFVSYLLFITGSLLSDLFYTTLLLPFIILSSYFLGKNDFVKSHKTLIFSFVLFPFLILLT